MKGYLAAIPAFLLLLSCSGKPQASGPADSGFVTEYLAPTRIIRVEGPAAGVDCLLEPYCGQVSTTEDRLARLRAGSSILLDFGKEIQGGIQIVRAMSGSHEAARFRLVLGESVSEALSDVHAPGSTATNDHSVRDGEISVPWLGVAEYGQSGFRFVRLDLLEDAGEGVALKAVRAVSRKRDLAYLGSFRCSDGRLNDIWQTGAYTVHLCMQDYLWDGIKRDRLVWLGDMHPEVMTALAVFGDQDVIRKSLDYVRDKTAPTRWMNGICSYSLWWIIIQRDLYSWSADLAYLKEQKAYLEALLQTVISNLEETPDGFREAYRNGRFIDWPSNDKPEVIHAGLQALTAAAFRAAAQIGKILGDEAMCRTCSEWATALSKTPTDAVGSSQAAALLSYGSMMDAGEASDVILRNGPGQFTSFMGYYMLEALARSGHYAEAMQLISDYWGRMLDLGATTFWEDFNFEDGKRAARIDEIVPEGMFDIHADGGAWCYKGLRHSFCHGWASGPTAWLSRHVLGVVPVDDGYREVFIAPNLGDLDWAEGTVPTPYGVIEVKHRKNADGSVSSQVTLPKGVRRLKKAK